MSRAAAGGRSTTAALNSCVASMHAAWIASAPPLSTSSSLKCRLILRPLIPPLALMSSTNAWTCFCWSPSCGTRPVAASALKSTPMKATLIASSVMPVVDDAVSFPAASPLAADPLPPDAPCLVDESGVHAASNIAPTTTSAAAQRPMTSSSSTSPWIGRLVALVTSRTARTSAGARGSASRSS